MKYGIFKKIIGAYSMDDGGTVEIIGNGRAIIEQVQNILEYENERVRICAGGLCVTVEGKALSLDSYSEKVMVVDGEIKNISFDKVI